MMTLEELIEDSVDVRELKRALGVKMVKEGLPPSQIASILNVSEQFVSKWKGKHEQEGPESLRLQYQGSHGYLTDAERLEVLDWIDSQTQINVEQLRDHLEATYAVVYRSKQSYYDLLQAGGMSYHRSTAINPKRDDEPILEKREAIKKKWLNTKKK